MASDPVIAVTLASRELPAMVHWRLMFEGLSDCGAVPLAIECGEAHVDMARILGQVDGLILSGGADVDPTRYGGNPNDPTLRGVNPIRDANEIAAFEVAWSRRLPTLAICRGLQLVNVVQGGTLYADLDRDMLSNIDHRLGEAALVGSAHQVQVEQGSRLAGWMDRAGRLDVNSQHHQGIRTLADGFAAAAWAADGLVEAYESPTHPLTAVQWHPEIGWINDDHARAVIGGFVASCAQPVPMREVSGSASI